MNMDIKVTTRSPEETEREAQNLVKKLKRGDIICLFGDLGAGKTIFSKGIAKGMGIKERIISPTFSLIREHEIDGGSPIKKLYHLDLYRVENKAEIRSIGIDDIFSDPESISIIEWAERLGEKIPKKCIRVHIDHKENDVRTITIQRNT